MRSSAYSLLILATCVFSGTSAAETLLDPSFGSAGLRTTPFDNGDPYTDELVRVLRTADGKYVSVGRASIGSNRRGIALSRHHADGSPDPGFGTGGKRVKDACMTAVTDAILDLQGRIVVVGETDCTSHGTDDAAVVRFLADGADDTSFAGDGGLGFAFATAPASDRGEAVVLDGTSGNLIVGGSYQPAGGTRDIRFARISSTGALGNTAALFSSSDNARIIRGLASSNHSHWLIQEIDAASGSTGVMLRLEHSTLTRSTGFGTNGILYLAHFPAPGTSYQPCATVSDVYFPLSMARHGERIVTFAWVTDDDIFVRTQFNAFNAADGGSYVSGCLNRGFNYGPRINDAVAGHEGDTLYAAVADRGDLGLWRLTVDPANPLGWIVDPTFHGSLPLEAVFQAATGEDPSAMGTSILQDGAHYLVGGTRRWDFLDTDFALAKYVDGELFSDGFE